MPLNVIGEIAKGVSLSFRLFGNIFAGSVLLFVIGTLIPVFVQSMFLGLEFFVGLIQALVFGFVVFYPFFRIRCPFTYHV